jgi:hypothetical protein
VGRSGKCLLQAVSSSTALTLASSSATERSALKDRRRPPLAALRCRRPSASCTKAASQASAASLQKIEASESEFDCSYAAVSFSGTKPMTHP